MSDLDQRCTIARMLWSILSTVATIIGVAWFAFYFALFNGWDDRLREMRARRAYGRRRT